MARSIRSRGPTVDTIFGFTGRYFDDDTGLQWNLNRWYDAGVGRWFSEDPIGFAGGDRHLYRYVGNSPGMFGDPNGLDGSGLSLSMLQDMAEQYAQNDPTPADAFVGSLASQAGDLLSTYPEGTYYLMTRPSARSDFGRTYYETPVQSPADRLYNKARMRGYSDACRHRGKRLFCGRRRSACDP
ncbi:MAG: RHS repeat-associated core domain-containing protein [Pirellulaceae bacterium]|nr:RHS repeat-associated core domain-containing protein [Pirellulaceae bacterium]